MLGSIKSGNTYTPAAGIRLDRGYEYDLMGSVVKERDRTPASAASQGPGSIERVFGHDPLRRLLSATGRESTVALVQPSWDLNVRPQDYTATNTYTRSYTYDKLGNIQTLRHVANGIPANNFTRRYNYPNGFGSNMLESMGIGASTYPYTYDANGNQTKENSDRYFEWNYADKLSFFKRQAGSGSPSLWVHYFYDASGQRIKKVVNKPGGIQEMTVYVDGVFEHSYVRINDNVDNNRNYNTLHVLDASSRIATLRVGKDSQDSTPELKYYVEDHLGNSSVAVQSNGNRINLEEYYPFGETSFGSFAKKRYRYNGKEKDEHTGLYEYGARYYAPWLCRFISVDPIAEDYPFYSSYNYAGNKPESKVDIEGLQEEGAQKQGGAQTQTEEKNSSWGESIINAIKEYFGVHNMTPETQYKAGLTSGLAAGAADLAELGFRLSDIGQFYDNLTGRETLTEEMKSGLTALTEALSTKQGRSDFIDAAKILMSEYSADAIGANGAFRAGEIHGRLGFDILLGLATEGAGNAVKLTSAFKKGPQAIAKLLSSKTSNLTKITKGLMKDFGPALDGGFGISKYYTYSTDVGIDIHVAPHAFKHLEELGTNAVNKYSPEYRQLIGQTYQKAINSAIDDVTERGPIIYDHMYKSGGNEIMFGKPRNIGELPAVKHFQ